MQLGAIQSNVKHSVKHCYGQPDVWDDSYGRMKGETKSNRLEIDITTSQHVVQRAGFWTRRKQFANTMVPSTWLEDNREDSAPRMTRDLYTICAVDRMQNSIKMQLIYNSE